jgi:hypothetical protein
MAKGVLFIILVGIIFTACSSETETVEVTRVVTEIAQVEVTREIDVIVKVEITREVEVTRELVVTRIVERVVTATSTPSPENSPTPSLTPTPSNTPTVTPSPSNTATPTPSMTPTATPNLAQTATIEAFGALASPKSNGLFTVGTEILPGKWHSTGTQNDCYWARLDANQDILDNHFGTAGGTVNIRATDYEVHFEDCGIWEYVENAEIILQDDAADSKGNGFYTVNVEIIPGRWQSTGTGDSCYWARLNGNQDILDNHFGLAGGTVAIRANDYEVQFEDCGFWEYLGP